MIAFAGCAEPAPGVLEVAIEVTSPEPEGGTLPWWTTEAGDWPHLFVQFRPATSEWPLESIWHPTPRDPEPIALPLASECAADPTRCRFTFSVVSDRTDIDLNIKIRFCAVITPDSARCEDLGEETVVSGSYVRIERPFYPGKRTWWNTWFFGVPPLEPPVMATVSKCDVAGCSEDAGWNWDGWIRNYCLGASDKHFCEEP